VGVGVASAAAGGAAAGASADACGAGSRGGIRLTCAPAGGVAIANAAAIAIGERNDFIDPRAILVLAR